MKRAGKIAWLVILILSAIQFFPSTKNMSEVAAINGIVRVDTIPPEVATILKTSCNDCHSNNTRYPWYSRIQPVGWWISYHVVQGKQELNFDEFAAYSPARQHHKLKEIEETIMNDEMPMPSYLWAHREAALTEADKATLVQWSRALRRQLETTYPADSLIRKKNKKR